MSSKPTSAAVPQSTQRPRSRHQTAKRTIGESGLSAAVGRSSPSRVSRARATLSACCFRLQVSVEHDDPHLLRVEALRVPPEPVEVPPPGAPVLPADENREIGLRVRKAREPFLRALEMVLRRVEPEHFRARGRTIAAWAPVELAEPFACPDGLGFLRADPRTHRLDPALEHTPTPGDEQPPTGAGFGGLLERRELLFQFLERLRREASLPFHSEHLDLGLPPAAEALLGASVVALNLELLHEGRGVLDQHAVEA